MNKMTFLLKSLLLILVISITGCGGSGSASSESSNNSNDSAENKHSTSDDAADIAFSDKPITSVVDGQTYAYRADFADWNNNTDVTFTIKNKPNWLIFNEKYGAITGLAKPFINIHKNVEYVYFDIEIIATLNGQVKSTKPFNIVITNEAGKIITKHIVFSATYADSETSITQADIDKHYQNVTAYFNYLSNGKQQVIFDIVHLEAMTVSREKMRTLYLSQTALNTVSPNSSITCDLTVTIPLARTWYNENKAGKNVSTEADFTFSEKLDDFSKCQYFDLGIMATQYLNIPEHINIDDYHSMLFMFYDDENFHAPLVSGFTKDFNVKQGEKGLDGYAYAITNMNDNQNQPFDEALYLEIDTEDRTMAEHDLLEENSKIMSDYYTQGQVPLTLSESSTAHEFIHLLGVGTHDNGLSRYGLDNSIFKTLETSLINNSWGPGNSVSYGDQFSIMGSRGHSIGLAPSTREFLGWIDSNDIHVIDSSSEGVIINDVYSTQGPSLTKVKVKGGYLYLSYHAGNGYDETLKHPLLEEHSQGIQIRYTGARNPANQYTLTTSTMLDPDEELFNDSFALKAGESYTIFNVEISTVSIDGVQAIFDVKYIN